MLTDYLAFRTASRNVRALADESEEFFKRHVEATESQDFEYFQQLAIDTFDWLMRADIQLRLAAAQKNEDDANIDIVMREALETWLAACDRADQPRDLLGKQCVSAEVYSRYVHCREEARAMLSPSSELTDAMAQLEQEAIIEYERGDAIEWDLH